MGIPLQAAAKALGAAQNANPPASAAEIQRLTDDLAAKQAAQNAAGEISRKLQQVANASAEQAREKADQAKFAGAAATSAEGVATQAEKNAKDAQDKADASAKTPTDKPVDADKNKVAKDPTVAGQEEQTPVEGQTPPAQGQTGTQACAKVVNDAATPNCPLTGTADTAPGTTPAKGGTTTGTQTGTESKGTSTGSSSQGTGSTSSSSTSSSSSQSSEKGGSDQ